MANLERLRRLGLSVIQSASDALTGGGSIGVFRRGMEQAITRSHTAAYIAATAERLKTTPKAIRGLSVIERKELRKQIDGQLKYLDGFISDLKAGKMTMAQAQSRAALYAGSAQATYGQARYPGLPFYPGDGGTPCLGNCRCSWHDEGDGKFSYQLGAAEHCAGCVDRAARSPYRVE